MILFRGSNIRRRIDEIIDSIPGQDPSTPVYSISEILSSNIAKVSIRDIEYVVRKLSKYSFLGPICTMRTILDSLLRLYTSREGRDLSSILRIALHLYSELYNSNSDSITSHFVQLLSNTEASIATVGYSTFMQDSILYARSKIKTVYVLEGYPIYPGRTLAASLKKAGIEVYHVPDEYAFWAVHKSNMTVIPIYGVSIDGGLVSDLSASILAHTAREYGVKVVGLGSPLFECTPTRDALKPTNVVFVKNIRRGRTSRRVEFTAFEWVHPGVFDIFVTPDGVYTSLTVEDIERSTMRIVGSFEEVLAKVLG